MLMRSNGIPDVVDDIINEIESEFHQLWSGSERFLEPLYEISKVGNNIILTVDLAGIQNKEHITLNLNENSLEVIAEFTKPVKWERWGTIQKEIGFISYRKIISLPVKVDPTKVKAIFNKGILTITIPNVRNRSVLKID